MLPQNKSIKVDYSHYDWLSIGLYILLLFCGLTMIFASEYIDGSSYTHFFDFGKSYGKQMIWIGVSLILVSSIQLIEGKIFELYAYVFYVFGALALFGVLFTAPIKGATSWYTLGGFSLQPSEFAKITTSLALAAFLNNSPIRTQEYKNQIYAALIIFFSMFLILLQGDAGSTLVYMALFLVLFRAGMIAWIYILAVIVATLFILTIYFENPWALLACMLIGAVSVFFRSWRKDLNYYLAIGLVILTAINYSLFVLDSIYVYTAIILDICCLIVLSFLNIKKNWQMHLLTFGTILTATGYIFSIDYVFHNLIGEHRKQRIWTWLRPDLADPLGALYNVDQSKFAIGSGGLWGKGFLEGERTKLDYVPEQSTDFIFCTVGEEWGFLGSAFIIAIFSCLIFRILYMAEKQRSSFNKYYAYSVGLILFFHLFINVGMTTGLVPVIGIPLPFISYGGSSLMSFSILLGIYFKLDSNKNRIYT